VPHPPGTTKPKLHKWQLNIEKMVLNFFCIFFVYTTATKATHYPITRDRKESGCQSRKINFVVLLGETPTTTIYHGTTRRSSTTKAKGKQASGYYLCWTTETISCNTVSFARWRYRIHSWPSSSQHPARSAWSQYSSTSEAGRLHRLLKPAASSSPNSLGIPIRPCGCFSWFWCCFLSTGQVIG